MITFFSFKLTDTESRYSIPEKEMLAIVRAIKEVAWLLMDSPSPTHVYTGHLSITQTMSCLGEVHGKVSRWIDQLTELPIKYHHRPNTNRIIKIANGLSRLRPNMQGDGAALPGRC